MIDETWYQQPADAVERLCAGGVVVRVEAGAVLIGLVREDDYPNWLVPKGGVDEGETLEQAARREILEEAGLTALDLVCELGVRERLNFRRTRWGKTHYFLFRTEQAEGTPIDTTRDYALGWHPIGSLPLMMWPEQEELIVTHRDEIIRRVAGPAK